MVSASAGVFRFTKAHWAHSMPARRSRLIAYSLATLREFGTAPAPSNFARAATEALSLRGRSAIRRSAIVSGCDHVDGVSGSAATKEVNLWFAAALGIRANSEASCQGSTSSRANAERTVSVIPFLSSPTGANRKALNSDPSWAAATERLISTTGVSWPFGHGNRPCRAWKNHTARRSAASGSETTQVKHRPEVDVSSFRSCLQPYEVAYQSGWLAS